MFCIVLDIEFEDLNNIKELGVVTDWNVQGFSFRAQEKYKPTKRAFWCKRNLHRIVSNSGCLDYSEFPNIVPSDVKSEYFAGTTAKCKILDRLLGKEVENMDDHRCPKSRDLFDEEMWICSNYTSRHKTTLHCLESAKQNCSVTGQCSIQSCTFFVLCKVSSVSTQLSFLND